MTKEMEGRPVIVGLGEVLWDVFPDGPRFGGAPANFACAAAALSADHDVFMVSGVGDDDLGQQALRELADRRVATDAVAVSSRPTGAVHVTLDESGSASYRFLEDTAWDCLTWNSQLQDLAGRCDAVCFGTLGQRSETSQKTILQFVDAMPESSLRIFDINLRPPYYSDDVIRQSIPLCNCLKLNDDELPVVAGLCSASGSQNELLKQIAAHWNLQTVALTCGSKGAVLCHDGEVIECSGQPASVVDTVGAGDSFTAALAIGLMQKMAPDEIGQRACRVAEFVCSQAGATPAIPAELRFSP